MPTLYYTSVHTKFPTVLKCPNFCSANTLFFKIVGAKAPIAPVLNMPQIFSTISSQSLSHSAHQTPNLEFQFPQWRNQDWMHGNFTQFF